MQCKEDFFKFDAKKLVFCDNESLFCSKLKDIFEKSSSFCKSIGFNVNPNENIVEYIENFNNFNETNPLCYNFHSSSNIYGPAEVVIQAKQSTENKKKSGKKLIFGGFFVAVLMFIFKF